MGRGESGSTATGASLFYGPRGLRTRDEAFSADPPTDQARERLNRILEEVGAGEFGEALSALARVRHELDAPLPRELLRLSAQAVAERASAESLQKLARTVQDRDIRLEIERYSDLIAAQIRAQLEQGARLRLQDLAADPAPLLREGYGPIAALHANSLCAASTPSPARLKLLAEHAERVPYAPLLRRIRDRELEIARALVEGRRARLGGRVSSAVPGLFRRLGFEAELGGELVHPSGGNSASEAHLRSRDDPRKTICGREISSRWFALERGMLTQLVGQTHSLRRGALPRLCERCESGCDQLPDSAFDPPEFPLLNARSTNEVYAKAAEKLQDLLWKSTVKPPDVLSVADCWQQAEREVCAELVAEKIAGESGEEQARRLLGNLDFEGYSKRISERGQEWPRLDEHQLTELLSLAMFREQYQLRHLDPAVTRSSSATQI